MKLDLLVISAHPDDAEMSCGGTIISHTNKGYKAGIIDLTMGELGTRGTPEVRLEEARKGAAIMNVSVRENLGMADGFFAKDPEHIKLVVEKIRQYQPHIVITNPLSDRHPDHERAGDLVKEACFLAGLRKLETKNDGAIQESWRPHSLFHFIQHTNHRPDFIVDISGCLDKKMEAIKAFKTQFYNPELDEPDTVLSDPGFLERLKSRSKQYGSEIFKEAGEGFLRSRMNGVNDLMHLL